MLIAINHVIVDDTFFWSGVNVIDFILGIVQRRFNVLDAHVNETTEITHESIANQSQQWSNVAFHFLLCHANAQF